MRRTLYTKTVVGARRTLLLWLYQPDAFPDATRTEAERGRPEGCPATWPVTRSTAVTWLLAHVRRWCRGHPPCGEGRRSNAARASASDNVDSGTCGPVHSDYRLARQALQLALRVLDLARLQQRPNDMAQALANIARSMKALGAHGSAEGYLEQALRWAGMLPGADARVDVLCELAEVACTIAETERDADETDFRAGLDARERARERACEAASLAGQTADPQWEVKVLLRVSDVLDRCGDHDEAATLQGRAVALMGLQHESLHTSDGAAAGAAEPLRAPGSTLLM